MLRSQRILLMVGLLFLAWFLHVNLCEWTFKERLPYGTENGVSSYYHTIIWTWKHEPTDTSSASAQRRVSPNAYTGLLTQASVGRADAVVFGIAAPLALMMVVSHLCLGWRRDGRAARGQCAACGYDLRGASRTDGRCPECGTVQSAAD